MSNTFLHIAVDLSARVCLSRERLSRRYDWQRLGCGIEALTIFCVPIDVAAQRFLKDFPRQEVNVGKIKNSDMALDIGSQTIEIPNTGRRRWLFGMVRFRLC